MKWPRSLSIRLAATYAGLFIASVGILLGLFFWISVQRPMDRLMDSITRDSEDLAQAYMIDGEAALLDQLRRRANAPGSPSFYSAFIDADRQRLLFNLPTLPGGLSNEWETIDADIYRGGREFDQLALLKTRHFENGAVLMVGRDIEKLNETSEQITAAAMWIIPVTFFLSLCGGYLMSRAIGVRVDRISDTARTVMAGDLSGRILVGGSGDEFDALAATLNAMLARIETNFESVRRVSDHVAHELRTPLARMALELEVAGQAEPGDREQRIADCASEVRRLNDIIGALLRISRIEGGSHVLAAREINASTLVGEVVEFHAPVAEESGIILSLDADPGITMRGDPDLLFQAVSNLIDNAVKFTPVRGQVTAKVELRSGETLISVSDNGCGIEDGEELKLTDRFYRGQAAEAIEGDGLGLSLVSAIVALHRGRILLMRLDPGLRVTLSFQNPSA